MSGLFHEDIPEQYIANIAAVMSLADWHTYQILTKRPKCLEKLLTGRLKDAAAAKHIWWGVTAENRRHGLPRIDALRRTGAAMKFLSIEPLLEDLGTFDLSGIDWVIVGGESGPGDRRLKEEWGVSIQQQCRAARVPFFFKQWGESRRERPAAKSTAGLGMGFRNQAARNGVPPITNAEPLKRPSTSFLNHDRDTNGCRQTVIRRQVDGGKVVQARKIPGSLRPDHEESGVG